MIRDMEINKAVNSKTKPNKKKKHKNPKDAFCFDPSSGASGDFTPGKINHQRANEAVFLTLRSFCASLKVITNGTSSFSLDLRSQNVHKLYTVVVIQ